MSDSASAIFFGIEVTRRCNQRCPHCYTSSGGRSAHPGPDAAALRVLVEKLAGCGVKEVAFSGGEPLLRKDLESLMTYGRRLGIRRFALVTNGTLLTPERAKSLAAAGLRSAQVSIDGVDVEDHCAVRACKPGDFYGALRAVRLFRDAGVLVDVASIINPRNIARAPEMALLCESIGARGLRYCSFVPAGRAVGEGLQDRFAVTEEQADDFLSFMQKLASHPEAPLRILIDHGIGPWKETGVFRCTAGERVAYCSAEGHLYPCPGLIFDPFIVGNVFDAPLRELLSDDKMHRHRKMARSELHGMCATCANDRCSGGCRGAAFAATGDERVAPAYCHFRPSAERTRAAPEIRIMTGVQRQTSWALTQPEAWTFSSDP